MEFFIKKKNDLGLTGTEENLLDYCLKTKSFVSNYFFRKICS